MIALLFIHSFGFLYIFLPFPRIYVQQILQNRIVSIVMVIGYAAMETPFVSKPKNNPSIDLLQNEWRM